MSKTQTDAEMKSLRGRIREARIDLDVALSKLKAAQTAHMAVKTLVDNLQTQIGVLEANVGDEIVVSEHALLRWLERVEGIDTAAIRTAMLSPNVERAIRQLKTCEVVTDKGYRLKVRNCTVVTVLEN